MVTYYGRDGQPLTDTIAWGKLLEDEEYKRVAKDVIGDVTISTVWIGLDHGYGDGPPLIFETMIFGGEHDAAEWRYSTEDEARLGHAHALTIVGAVA